MVDCNSKEDEGNLNSFDGKFYLKTYFSTVQSCDGTTEFIMNYYHDIFNSGKLKGSTLLDIGTGPSICQVIEQCLKFDHVYLGDLPESNRLALSNWHTDHSFHDHSPFFKHVADKFADGRTWKDIQAKVDRSLRGFLFCDVRNSNPLSPSYFPQFDVITTTNCLHTVPQTIEEYRDIVRNVSSLLKPGGWIVKVGHLEETYYMVKDLRIKVLYMNKEDFHKIWTEEGFTIQNWTELYPETYDRNKYTDWKCVFGFVAKKKDLQEIQVCKES